MAKDPRQPHGGDDPEDSGSADKFTWRPGEVVWTRKPTSAQQLAGRLKANEGPGRPVKKR